MNNKHIEHKQQGRERPIGSEERKENHRSPSPPPIRRNRQEKSQKPDTSSVRRPKVNEVKNLREIVVYLHLITLEESLYYGIEV